MALNVPVSGTPIGPDGIYTTVWFGEFTISFCASIASCWMYIPLNWPRMICMALAMPCACTSRLVRSFRSISISVSFRCSSCVAASLRDTAVATSSGYCTLPTTTLLMMKGLPAA